MATTTTGWAGSWIAPTPATAAGGSLAAATYSPWAEQPAADEPAGPLGSGCRAISRGDRPEVAESGWYAPVLAVFTAHDTVFGEPGTHPLFDDVSDTVVTPHQSERAVTGWDTHG